MKKSFFHNLRKKIVNKKLLFFFILRMTFAQFFVMFTFTITAFGYDPANCHFANGYQASQLFTSPSLQEDFLMRSAWWHGVFARDGIGVAFNRGMSYYGIYHGGKRIRYGTYDHFIVDDAVNHYGWEIFPRSEGLHLAMLALAIDGDIYAREMFGSSKWQTWSVNDYVIDQLEKKIQLLQGFVQQYPGCGGWIPEMTLYTGNWLNSYFTLPKKPYISAIHNGIFGWSMVATAQVSRYFTLTDYKNHIYLKKLRAHGLGLGPT